MFHKSKQQKHAALESKTGRVLPGQKRKLVFTMALPFVKRWSSDENYISAEQRMKILILHE